MASRTPLQNTQQSGVFCIMHRLLQHPLYIMLPEKLYLLVNHFYEETRQYKKAHVQEIKVSIRIVTMLLSRFLSDFFWSYSSSLGPLVPSVTCSWCVIARAVTAPELPRFLLEGGGGEATAAAVTAHCSGCQPGCATEHRTEPKRLLLTQIMLSLAVTPNIWHKASKAVIRGNLRCKRKM